MTRRGMPVRVLEHVRLSTVQMSVAHRQRVWNRHPDGGSMGLGTSPSRIRRSLSALRRGSGTGTADSSATE